jgi:antitoxin component of MazEF toxin-antitoxin module
MTTKIQKWGNSLAVRLPKKLVTRLRLREGSKVVVGENNKQVIITKAVELGRSLSKKDWKQFVLPQKGRKENISGKIDEIVYGASR